MANITLGENDGHKLESATKSEADMQEDIPAALRMLQRHDAMDCAEALGIS